MASVHTTVTFLELNTGWYARDFCAHTQEVGLKGSAPIRGEDTCVSLRQLWVFKNAVFAQ